MLNRCARLTFDLEHCEYLDSTCLGTLHEIVMSRPDAVDLQHLPDKLRAMFEELSMEGVLSHASSEGVALPEDMQALHNTELDPAQQGARMLSAHEALASLSPENREMFQGVVDSLRTDLDTSD